MQNNYNRYAIIIFALLYQLLLAGCSVTPSAPDLTQPGQSSNVEQSLQKLYALARQSESPDSELYRIQAADLLSQNQRFKEASNIIKGLTTQQLPPSAIASIAIISAEIALSRFDADAALNSLNQHAEIIAQQSQASQLRADLLRARSLELLARHLDSARERIHLSPFLEAEQVRHNEIAIWSSLMKVTTPTLQTAIATNNNSDELGWLTLAYLAQSQRTDLDAQLKALKQWRQNWAGHPAALNLPEELALLDKIASQRPANIVLMLPLQGRNAIAGQAIRDGFLAAYYAAQGAQNPTPTIKIVDTSTTTDFLALYEQISTSDADFIIGPLEKQHVQSLQAQPELLIPTLALNYGATDNSTQQLYQFGLSAEDEARQVAIKARHAGYKNTLLLAPDTSWGRRIAAAFNEEWQQGGGNLLKSAYFGEQRSYSAAIQDLFDINASEQRAKRITGLLARNLEFTPQGRSDVDFIFVVATPKQARQIKPTLAFHFAGNIPVYATSHIYSGTPSPQLDRDLNGIIFCETPWLLDYQNNPMKNAIARNWSGTAQPLGRLYALGVDAYHLYPRIQLLSTANHNQFPGATGLLTLDASGRVVRTLEWAQMQNGKIKPLN